MNEADLVDAVAQMWVTELLSLIEANETPNQEADIRRLQATLDEWEILRVASVRRAILTRLEAAQMGRVLALTNVQKGFDPQQDQTN